MHKEVVRGWLLSQSDEEGFFPVSTFFFTKRTCLVSRIC